MNIAFEFNWIVFDETIERIIKYSAITSNKFLGLIAWTLWLSLQLAGIIVIITTIITIIYFILRRFNKELVEDMKNIILNILKENFLQK